MHCPGRAALRPVGGGQPPGWCVAPSSWRIEPTRRHRMSARWAWWTGRSVQRIEQVRVVRLARGVMHRARYATQRPGGCRQPCDWSDHPAGGCDNPVGGSDHPAGGSADPVVGSDYSAGRCVHRPAEYESGAVPDDSVGRAALPMVIDHGEYPAPWRGTFPMSSLST